MTFFFLIAPHEMLIAQMYCVSIYISHLCICALNIEKVRFLHSQENQVHLFRGNVTSPLKIHIQSQIDYECMLT